MQVEGPKSPEELLTVLQRVLEESAPVLISARVEAEERRTNIRLREEQDAAYRAALEADQVCFCPYNVTVLFYLLYTLVVCCSNNFIVGPFYNFLFVMGVL